MLLLEASGSGSSNSESNAESGTDDYWWLLVLPFVLFGFMFRSVRPDAGSEKPAMGAGPDGPQADDVHATVLQSPAMAAPGSIVNATMVPMSGIGTPGAAPAKGPGVASASAAPDLGLAALNDPDAGNAATRGQGPSWRSPPAAAGVAAPNTVPTSMAVQHANPGDPEGHAGPGVPSSGISPSTATQHANPGDPDGLAGHGVPVGGISPSTAMQHANPGADPDRSDDTDVATSLTPAMPSAAATRAQAPSWRAQKFNLVPLDMDDIGIPTSAAFPQGGAGGSTGAPGNIDKASVGAAPTAPPTGADPAGGVNAMPFSATTMVRRAKLEPNNAESMSHPSGFTVVPSNMTLKGTNNAPPGTALGQSGPIGSEPSATNAGATSSGGGGSGPGTVVSPSNVYGVPGSTGTLKAVRMANPSYDDDDGIAGPALPDPSLHPGMAHQGQQPLGGGPGSSDGTTTATATAGDDGAPKLAGSETPTNSVSPADIHSAARGTNPNTPSGSGLFAPPTRITSSPSTSGLGNALDAPLLLLPGVAVPDQVDLLTSRLASLHEQVDSLGEPDGLPPKGARSKPLSKQMKSATKATAAARKALNAADKVLQKLPLGSSDAAPNEYAAANRGFQPPAPGSPSLGSTNPGYAAHREPASDGAPPGSTGRTAADADMDPSSSTPGSVGDQSPAGNQVRNTTVNTGMPATPAYSASSTAAPLHDAVLSKPGGASVDQTDPSVLSEGAIDNGDQSGQTGFGSQTPNRGRLPVAAGSPPVASAACASPASDAKDMKKLKKAFAACATAEKAAQQAADAWAAVLDNTATAGVEAVHATVGGTPGIGAAIQMAERATNSALAGDGKDGTAVPDEYMASEGAAAYLPSSPPAVPLKGIRRNNNKNKSMKDLGLPPPAFERPPSFGDDGNDEYRSSAGTNAPTTSVAPSHVPRFLKANARNNPHARTNWRNPTTGEAAAEPEVEFAHSQDNNLRVKSVVRKNPLYRSSVAPSGANRMSLMLDGSDTSTSQSDPISVVRKNPLYRSSVALNGANRMSLLLDGSDTSTSQSDPIQVLEALQAHNEPDSIEARSASYANALVEEDEDEEA